MPGPEAGAGFDYQRDVAAGCLAELLKQAFPGETTTVVTVTIDWVYSDNADIIVQHQGGVEERIHVRSGSHSNKDARRSLWQNMFKTWAGWSTAARGSNRLVLVSTPSTYVTSLRTLREHLASPSGESCLPKSARRRLSEISAFANEIGVPYHEIVSLIARLDVRVVEDVTTSKSLEERLAYIPAPYRSAWRAALVELARSRRTYSVEDLEDVARRDAIYLPELISFLPGERAAEYESGTLFVPDGVIWTKLHDLLLNKTEPRPFVAQFPYVYLHGLESALHALLFSSAVGYDPLIADVRHEHHPVPSLKAKGFDRLFEIRLPEGFDLERTAQQHKAELIARLARLTPSGHLIEHYTEARSPRCFSIPWRT